MPEPSLVEWLSARLDEDEEAALLADDAGPWRAATDVGDYYNRGVVVVGGESEYHWNEMVASCGVEGLDNGDSRARHIARWDPARVLTEVAAKRHIAELHGDQHECSSGADAYAYPYLGCQTLRLLALPYAGRDGYRDEWRPE